LLDAVQDTFVVTVATVIPIEAPSLHVSGVTTSIVEPVSGACVTSIVLLMPPPDTVIVPLRSDDPVLAVALNVIVPLPVSPEGDTVSQDAALLVAVQDTFDVTVIVVLSAECPGFQVVGATTRYAGAD